MIKGNTYTFDLMQYLLPRCSTLVVPRRIWVRAFTLTTQFSCVESRRVLLESNFSPSELLLQRFAVHTWFIRRRSQWVREAHTLLLIVCRTEMAPVDRCRRYEGRDSRRGEGHSIRMHRSPGVRSHLGAGFLLVLCWCCLLNQGENGFLKLLLRNMFTVCVCHVCMCVCGCVVWCLYVCVCVCVCVCVVWLCCVCVHYIVLCVVVICV